MPVIELSSDPKILSQQLQEGINNATLLGNTRAVNVLTDMSASLKKWKRLTAGQIRYATSLVNQCNPEQIALNDEWAEKCNSKENASLRAEALVVAQYYLSTAYYNSPASDVVQGRVPRREQFNRMFDNPYAKKVLESAKSEPVWNVGDLVQLRSTSSGRYHRAAGKWDYTVARKVYDHVYTIIKVDSRPIDRPLKYNKKTGGSRYYRLLPLGGIHQIDAMECDLKKARDKVVYGEKQKK